MLVVERARTDLVELHTFAHTPTDHHVANEWWPRSCVAFTAVGSWEIRCGRGRSEVRTDTVLIGEGRTEYDCLHEDGLNDRALCITYRTDVAPGQALALPVGPRLHALRRSLVTELRRTEPDGTTIDELCLDLLALTRYPVERPRRPAATTRAVIARLRAEADSRYTDPSLDLVAEASFLGMSRTRFVHSFRELVGVTPHQYVLALRTTQAARLLTSTRTPVTEICFATGFGSVARFQVAFRDAFGATPTTYRGRYGSG